MLTTRARDALARRALRTPATQSCTSLPVPIRITSGSPSFGVGQDIGAPRQPRGRRVAGAVERRQRLAAEDQAGGLMPERGDDDPPRLDDLVGVGRAQRDQAGDRAQGDQLLDRLVGRAVLADADRIVREHVDDRQLHQRPEPDRRLHVVAEDQEARAEGADLGQREAVDDRAHGVLAHAEVQVAPAGVRRPADRRRPRTSGASWSRARGRPRRRSARDSACAMAFSTLPEDSRLAMPLASAGNSAGPRPSLRAARAAASARSDRRAPDGALR